MLSCGLYDVEEGAYKAQVGFTTDLNYYGDALSFWIPMGHITITRYLSMNLDTTTDFIIIQKDF